jgi:hypothetical protein
MPHHRDGVSQWVVIRRRDKHLVAAHFRFPDGSVLTASFAELRVAP